MSDPASDGHLSNNPSAFWRAMSRLLSRHRNVTEEDILDLIDQSEETGVIEEAQKDMINNILEFSDMTAEDIMTPRTDVEAVDVEDSVQEALRISMENGFSRVPIYEDDLDHVIGVLHIKDLLPYVGKPLPDDLTLRSLMHKAHFVPASKRCDELFEEMTEKHIQLTMAVDEYGGLAGIVSMEDLLESIVGSIQDEYDNEEDEVKQTGDNTFEVDASMAIDEVGDLLDVDFPEGDYDTLAGFLIDRLGRIPTENEQAQVLFENLELTVLKMDERRIDLVRILKKESENE